MKKTFSQKIIIGLLAVLMVGGSFYIRTAEATVPTSCNGSVSVSFDKAKKCADDSVAEALRIRNSVNSSSSTEDISRAISDVNAISNRLFNIEEEVPQGFLGNLEVLISDVPKIVNDAKQIVDGYAIELREARNQNTPRPGEQEAIEQERRAAAEEAARNSAREGGSCDLTDVPCWIRTAIYALGGIFKYIFGGVLYLVGLVFDLSIKVSILDFSTYANSPGVANAWTTLRDLANVFFIFILLYILANYDKIILV